LDNNITIEKEIKELFKEEENDNCSFSNSNDTTINVINNSKLKDKIRKYMTIKMC
jgi:hypothetical protein